MSEISGKDVVLFLDYDGTLAPIVEHPAQAFMSPETKKVLERLSRNSRCHLAVVSGRALDDLKERVGIKKIIYVGNHGFEIAGPGIHFENGHFPQTRKAYNQILAELSEPLKANPEVFIEDKRITISIHVRRLDEKRKPSFQKALYGVVRPYTRLKNVFLREGKEVYELRPPVEWDKGKAVLWLLNSFDNQVVSIYAGDDQTDEDAFRVLKDKSLTIRVGEPAATEAQFYVQSPNEIAALLLEIESLLKNL